MNRCITIITLVTCALTFPGSAELARWGDYLPVSEKPPVIFVTGHDSICPDARSGELPFFNLTFGDFDKVMARDGRISLVFEACYAPNRPPVEEIANVLRRLLSSLRYDNGEPVREVDVVAHSMGGLIVRAYLAGKQSNGTFLTQAAPRVRKAVFIGTPHFGTPVASSTSTDPQLREMSPGSAFLFDLATWNQGSDDLNGAEALSIAGTGGRNGPVTDSVVRITSASIDFIAPGRTAVLPYCHTQGGIGQLFLCDSAPGLARVTSEDHPTAQLVLAFLNDLDSWRSVTAAASGALSTGAGLIVQSRTADDIPLPIHSAVFRHDSGTVVPLAISDVGLAYADLLPSGPGTLSVDSVTRRIVLPAGGSRARVVKPGPMIDAVEPAAGQTSPHVVASGMLVFIRGVELNAAARQLDLADKPVPVLSVTDDKLIALIPEGVTGLADLRLRNAAGQHTIHVVVESTFPVFFLRDGAAAALHSSTGKPVSASDPVFAGEVISLFLTGLGAVSAAPGGLPVAVEQPLVRVAGRPCEVLYAGRAPADPGVDQINCRVSADAEFKVKLVPVQVTSGNRTATADLWVAGK